MTNDNVVSFNPYSDALFRGLEFKVGPQLVSDPSPEYRFKNLTMQSELGNAITTAEELINLALSNGDRRLAEQIAAIKGGLHGYIRDLDAMEAADE